MRDDVPYVDNWDDGVKLQKSATTKPISKTEALPDFDTTLTDKVEDIKNFKWDKYAKVEYTDANGKKHSFSFDPDYLVEPKFVDFIKEFKGQRGILAEADRHRATGGDMGGPLYTALKTNHIEVIGPDGKKYRGKFANMNLTQMTKLKNKVINHKTGQIFVHVMDEEAHKSNKRTARALDKMMRDANLSKEQQEIIHLSMQYGKIRLKQAEINKSINKINEKINELTQEGKITPEDISKAEKEISELNKELENITPKGEEAVIYDTIKRYGTAHATVNRSKKVGKSKVTMDAEFQKIKDLSTTETYKKMIGKDNSNFISDNIGATFDERAAAIGNIIKYKFGDFNPKRYLKDTMDFPEANNLDIVSTFEVSQNPDFFAVYFGDDPKQEAAMSTAEREARDTLKNDPNFVAHEAYDWMPLGPAKGKDFIATTPIQAEAFFPGYRKASTNKNVKRGRPETVAGSMKRGASVITIVGKDAIRYKPKESKKTIKKTTKKVNDIE